MPFLKKGKGEGKGFLKYSLYLFYFILLFLFFLYLLFPYDKLKERMIFEIESRSSLSVKINKLSPLLFNGIKLTDAEVSLKNDPKKTPLFKGDARLRLSLLQLIRLGLSVKGSIKAYNGEAALNIANNRIAGEIRGIDISSYAALKALFGIDAAGIINGRMDVSSSNNMLSANGMGLTKAGGEARFDISQFSLRNVNILGIKLPDTSFDAVQSEMRLEQGRVNIKKLSLEGRDLNLYVSGDIVIAGDMLSSPLNITVRIKPSVRFEEENKVFFSMSKGKGPDGFYNINIRGTLRSPAVS
jgi:type II secretion system protein N